MKKIILLAVLSFGIVNSSIIARDIVNPINEELQITIDTRAKDIIIINLSTHEVISVASSAELKTAISSLPSGNYKLRYRVEESKYRMYFSKP